MNEDLAHLLTEHAPEEIDAANELLDRRPCGRARSFRVTGTPRDVVFLRCGRQPGHEGPCVYLARRSESVAARAACVGETADYLRRNLEAWASAGGEERRRVARHLEFYRWLFMTGQVQP